MTDCALYYGWYAKTWPALSISQASDSFRARSRFISIHSAPARCGIRMPAGWVRLSRGARRRASATFTNRICKSPPTSISSTTGSCMDLLSPKALMLRSRRSPGWRWWSAIRFTGRTRHGCNWMRRAIRAKPRVGGCTMSSPQSIIPTLRPIPIARATGRVAREKLSDDRGSRIDGSARWKFCRRDKLFSASPHRLHGARRHFARGAGRSGCMDQTEQTEARARLGSKRFKDNFQRARYTFTPKSRTRFEPNRRKKP